MIFIHVFCYEIASAIKSSQNSRVWHKYLIDLLSSDSSLMKTQLLSDSSFVLTQLNTKYYLMNSCDPNMWQTARGCSGSVDRLLTVTTTCSFEMVHFQFDFTEIQKLNSLSRFPELALKAQAFFVVFSFQRTTSYLFNLKLWKVL